MDKIKVLLVDDEAKILKLLKNNLETTNELYDIVIVESGKQALDALANSTFDIMVTDIRMPGMDGIELIQKAKQVAPEIQPIVMSGHGDFDHAIAALKQGVVNYLKKPFSIREIDIALRASWEKALLSKQLKESEEKHRLLIENSGDAIFVIQDNHIVFANPKTYSLTGYGDDIFQLSFFDLIYKDDKDKFNRISDIEKSKLSRFRIVTKQNAIKWVELNMVETIWNDKQSELCFLRDITRMKELEDQLRQSQKMEALGCLAAGIAHDFNNILAGILGNAELAIINSSMVEKVFSNLSKIKMLSLRAKDIISKILAFSHKMEFEKKPTDINNTIAETLDLLNSTTPKHIQVNRLLLKEPCYVLADSSQICQLLMNLYTNSIQAIQNTYGVLDIELSIFQLDKDSTKPVPNIEPGNYVKLSVKDTGCGIPDNIIDKVFEPYFTTKGIGKGSGLGLSVVHGIVKQHDGHIGIRSVVNKGTTIDVFFPVLSGNFELPVTKTEDIAKGKGNILVVDDEEMIVSLINEMLSNIGYNVQEFTSPTDALKEIDQNPKKYDLIITDNFMPSMTGVDFSNKVLLINDAMRIILLTGTMIDRSSNAKLFKKILRKPVEMYDLIGAVNNVIQGE